MEGLTNQWLYLFPLLFSIHQSRVFFHKQLSVIIIWSGEMKETIQSSFSVMVMKPQGILIRNPITFQCFMEGALNRLFPSYLPYFIALDSILLCCNWIKWNKRYINVSRNTCSHLVMFTWVSLWLVDHVFCFWVMSCPISLMSQTISVIPYPVSVLSTYFSHVCCVCVLSYSYQSNLTCLSHF